MSVSSKPPTGRSAQSPLSKWSSSKGSRSSPTRSDDDDENAYEKINVVNQGKFSRTTPSNMSDDDDDDKYNKKNFKQRNSDDEDENNSIRSLNKSKNRYVPKKRDSDESDGAEDQNNRNFNISRGNLFR
jgi:hypothetical protein